MNKFLSFVLKVVVIVSWKTHAQTPDSQHPVKPCEGALEILSADHLIMIDELIRLEQKQLSETSEHTRAVLGNELGRKHEEIKNLLSAEQRILFVKELQQKREGTQTINNAIAVNNTTEELEAIKRDQNLIDSHRTSIKGKSFTRLSKKGEPEIWQDDTPLPEDIKDESGKVIFKDGDLVKWHPVAPKKMNWRQAKLFCQRLGLIFPPIEVFKHSESNGFSKDNNENVLVSNLEDIYWSSTLSSTHGHLFALTFSRDNIRSDQSMMRQNLYSVRCVSIERGAQP